MASFELVSSFSLKYSWCTKHMLQVCNTVIPNFQRLYSTYEYCKIFAKSPVLCNISPWLVFYLIVCPLTLSNLNFPFILHSPHREPITYSHYVWVCFFFVRFISWLYFLDSPCKWYHTVFVLLWLLSLSIMPRVIFFMLLPVALFHPLFYGWAAYIYHIFFIHSSVDGHLGCLCILTILINAVLNIGAHVSFWICVLFLPDIHSGEELLSHTVVPSSAFWETSILSS